MFNNINNNTFKNPFTFKASFNEEIQGEINIKIQCRELLLSNNVEGFLKMIRTLNDNPHMNSIPSENIRKHKANFVKNYIIENEIKNIFFSLGNKNKSQISVEMLQAIINSLYTTQNASTNLKSFLHTALLQLLSYENDTKPLLYILDKTTQVNPSVFNYLGIDLCTILLKNSSTECFKALIDFFVNKQPFQKLDYEDIHEYDFIPIGNFLEICFQICINKHLFSQLELLLQILNSEQIEGIINSQYVRISVADKFEMLRDVKSEKVLKWFKDVCEVNNNLQDGMKNYALYYRCESMM